MLGGSGLVIYLAMWIIVPNEPAAGGVIQLRVGSPHPYGTHGAARPREMPDSTALRRRSLIRMGWGRPSIGAPITRPKVRSLLAPYPVAHGR